MTAHDRQFRESKNQANRPLAGATPSARCHGILRDMVTERGMLAAALERRVVALAVVENAPPEMVIAAFCDEKNPAILETSLPAHGGAGYSIFACNPVDEFVQNANDLSCPFQGLEKRMAPDAISVPPGWHLPFCGGWIGYFTYESGLTVEKLRTRKQSQRLLPAAHWNFYDAAAVYDHRARQWHAVAIDGPGSDFAPRVSVEEKLERVRSRIAAAGKLELPVTRKVSTAKVTDMSLSPHVGDHRPSYSAAFDKAMRYIEAGDIYQVNLTQRFTVETTATPLENYLRLRSVSPSPYAAFLPWDEGAIISASPELFLSLRGRQVVTRPIKGTRPRGANSAEDHLGRKDLESSEKDRAELNMIIDLLRNDLGRVSRYGTVRVADAGSIEEHPTVFHRVAAVEGELRPGVGMAELLRATMPGGSVTGCPKIRAMQVIDELEPHPREVYCGAIGMVGCDGNMTLNVAIRTMLQRGGTVHAYAGGAVVADSICASEYGEIEAKAAGMLRALGANAT